MVQQSHSSGNGFSGFQELTTPGNEFNEQQFFVQSMLSKIATATVVKVMAVTNNGGLSPVGFVDIMPMVNQLDGSGNAMPHGTIFHCPYFRLQGGVNAVILDPQVGDIGIAVFASRDISSVIANKGKANPGSRRDFDMADGLYIGGVLNGVPEQYVQFNTDGITVVSPTKVTLRAPNIELDGNVSSIGTFRNNDVNIGSTHVHGGVSIGVADTGVPV